MSERSYGRIWFNGGILFLLLSIWAYGLTQNWFNQGAHGSYGLAVYGILGNGTLFLIYAWLLIAYAVRSPSNKWHLKLPIYPSSMNPTTTEARVLQRVFFFFFLFIPAFIIGHCAIKYLKGTVEYTPPIITSQMVEANGAPPKESIVGLVHLTRYRPLSEAFSKKARGAYEHHGLKKMDYFPFWGPWFLLGWSILSIASFLLLASIVFIKQESHAFAKWMLRKILFQKSLFRTLTTPKKFSYGNRDAHNKSAFEYDIFLSHASEDKPAVEHLKEELEGAGFAVWMDIGAIKPGLSITKTINQGLMACRYAAVVLSPSFFQKEWTQLELEFLLELEERAGEIIIPVWHNIHGSDIRKHNDGLADRLALLLDKHTSTELTKILNK